MIEKTVEARTTTASDRTRVKSGRMTISRRNSEAISRVSE
jgi:hypothetical protein